MCFVILKDLHLFTVSQPPNFGQAARKEIVPVLTTPEKEARKMKDFRDGIEHFWSLGCSKIFEENVQKWGNDPILTCANICFFRRLVQLTFRVDVYQQKLHSGNQT